MPLKFVGIEPNYLLIRIIRDFHPFPLSVPPWLESGNSK